VSCETAKETKTKCLTIGKKEGRDMEMFRGSVVIATLGLLVGTSVPASNTDAQTPGVVIVQPSQPATTYPEGRYELRGDGTAGSPYSWVWIPTGVQSVPPPAPPPSNVQASQRVYSYPEGRYELRGDGTAGSPYYWVWIPTGVQSVPPPPPIGTVSSAPAGFQSGLKSAEGQIDHVGYLGRSIRLSDGQEFEVPDWSAVTNTPAVGQRVVVTYYVAQDGRNVARAIDHNAAK
jgi:hypothetical protein